MKVLVADKLPPTALETLRGAGLEVHSAPGLKEDALTAALAEVQPEALIVRSTKVGAAMLDAASELGLVVRAGAGVNTIDVAAAAARGVYVCNCPGRNAAAVAELTMGLLCALDRRIPEAVRDLREGRFRKKHYGAALGLRGRTLGVVGAGGIGQAVLQAAAGFGMKTAAWSRSGSRRAEVEELGAEWVPDLHALAARCDVLSVHVAASAETKGLIGRSVFDAMPDGAYFLNTSRADVVDEDALLRALDEKGLRAGLDVFAGEPAGDEAEVDLPLLRHPSVWATPHIGASTDQAQESVADEAVRLVLAYQRTGRPENCVNVAATAAASHLLVVRHLNRVGVLARVFVALKRAAINVEETENIVFDGGEACIARIHIAGRPDPAVLEALLASGPDILGLSLKPAR